MLVNSAKQCKAISGSSKDCKEPAGMHGNKLQLGVPGWPKPLHLGPTHT